MPFIFRAIISVTVRNWRWMFDPTASSPSLRLPEVNLEPEELKNLIHQVLNGLLG